MIATATCNDRSGLIGDSETFFRAPTNSGEPMVAEPGTGNRGLMACGALEMGNVDLAWQFTSLTIARRGFQANSRVITASAEVLSDLVNLKR